VVSVGADNLSFKLPHSRHIIHQIVAPLGCLRAEHTGNSPDGFDGREEVWWLYGG
jgi:hypothetical protein